MASFSDDIKTQYEPTLKFAKLHTPKMKSVYWRHFGFPSNEQDEVISKQNVVCLLCHKVLTNHGNTTNLRAHLQHRHKEVFEKICRDNAIKVPPRKKYSSSPLSSAPPTPSTSTKRIKSDFLQLLKKPKDELQCEDDAALEQDIATAHVISASAEDDEDEDEEAMLYETMVPLTYEEGEEGIDEGGSLSYAKVEVHTLKSNYEHDEEEQNAMVKANKKRRLIRNETVYKPVEKKRSIYVQDLPMYQINFALMNCVIEDLRNVETLFESGMQSLLRTLTGDVSLPTQIEIEDTIREQHLSKFEVHSEYIKLLSHEKLYSLGFDLWTNVEHRRYFTIYCNFINEEANYTMVNQLFATVEYNMEYNSIGDVLAELDLSNCTSIVVNFDHDDTFKLFFKDYNINVFLAFDYVIEKCLRSVFALSEVASVVEQVKDVMTRYAAEITTKDLPVPVRNEEFLWTYYDWLQFFCDSISWSEDFDNLVNSAKAIVDAIGSLVVTLETIKGEDIPPSSMLAPVTSKILSKKLCISEQDDTFSMELKRTIRAVLQTHITSNENLTIAALLDPRFHRLTPVEDYDNLMVSLKKKYNEIGGSIAESDTSNTSANVSSFTKDHAAVIKRSPNTSNKSVNENKKTKLELFFDLTDTPTPPIKQIESSLETDLKRYRSEVLVSLDESPYNWWQSMGHIYCSLRQLAPHYQCVPSVVNLNFKKSLKTQIAEHTKRHLLTGDLIDAILYLNHHK